MIHALVNRAHTPQTLHAPPPTFLNIKSEYEHK